MRQKRNLWQYHWACLVLAIYRWAWNLPWSVAYMSRGTYIFIGENYFFLCKQLSMEIASELGVGAHVHFSSLCWDSICLPHELQTQRSRLPSWSPNKELLLVSLLHGVNVNGGASPLMGDSGSSMEPTWTPEAHGDGAVTGAHTLLPSACIHCPAEMELCMYEMLETGPRTGQTWSLVFDSSQCAVCSRQWRGQWLTNASHIPGTLQTFYMCSCA